MLSSLEKLLFVGLSRKNVDEAVLSLLCCLHSSTFNFLTQKSQDTCCPWIFSLVFGNPTQFPELGSLAFGEALSYLYVKNESQHKTLISPPVS